MIIIQEPFILEMMQEIIANGLALNMVSWQDKDTRALHFRVEIIYFTTPNIYYRAYSATGDSLMNTLSSVYLQMRRKQPYVDGPKQPQKDIQITADAIMDIFKEDVT